MKKAILFLAGLILLSMITNACSPESRVVSGNNRMNSPGKLSSLQSKGILFAGNIGKPSSLLFSLTAAIPAPGLGFRGQDVKTPHALNAGTRSIPVSLRSSE